MKIRTDFVTNSSSSSFVVEVNINYSGGQITLGPTLDDGNGNLHETFHGDLRAINSYLSSVRCLAKWLADSTERVSEFDAEEKEAFIEEAVECISSVRDIDSVVVERHYEAWGEFAELLADSWEMMEMAKKYVSSSGLEKERAKAEFVTYIMTATDINGNFFAEHSDIARYRLGCDIDDLAKRLCTNYGPRDVSGVETQKIDLRTGEYFNTSDFDVS